jgi:hypothetical protein
VARGKGGRAGLTGVEGEAVARGKRQRVAIDRRALVLAAQTAKRQPRITFYSPASSVILNYLKNTRPRFSISDEVAGIVESELARKYPELISFVKRMVRGSGDARG